MCIIQNCYEQAHAVSDYTESIFESIKHVNEYGVEFWYAREFQTKVSYRLKKNVLNWKIQKWKYDKRENAKGISYNSFAFSLK